MQDTRGTVALFHYSKNVHRISQSMMPVSSDGCWPMHDVDADNFECISAYSCCYCCAIFAAATHRGALLDPAACLGYGTLAYVNDRRA